MRFASLGSGSGGNALLLEHGQTRLLLDCGFSARETTQRLQRLGVEPSQVSGILLTHEHDDHAGGAFRFAARHNVPLWLTHGTLRGAHSYVPAHFDAPLNIIDGHTALEIGDIAVQPYPVPHDSEEPVQYTFSDGAHKLGVLTDTGSSTPHIEAMLHDCDALALECNHDLDMLKNGSYAWPLKQRILGRQGHLDNASAAALLSRLQRQKLQHIVALHLSEHNNTPELARSALAAVLNCEQHWVGVASQAQGFGWRELA
jgi:phosphoribosyl 1,2-cyclic phosphodiesterase